MKNEERRMKINKLAVTGNFKLICLCKKAGIPPLHPLGKFKILDFVLYTSGLNFT